MEDIQKLPRFYPSYGNLAKKKKDEICMEVTLHPFVCLGREQIESS